MTTESARPLVDLEEWMPLLAPDVKYLVFASTSDPSRYMGFGAKVFKATDRIYLAVAPARHAQWLSDRLASGLMSARTFDTYNDAMERAGELAFL